MNSELAIFILCISSVILNETIGYSTLGIYFVLFQIFLIFLYFIRKNYLKSWNLFLIFSLTALEFPADLALRPEIYTFRNVSFFNISVSTWILMFFFLYFSFIEGHILEVFKNLKKYEIIIFLLFICSVLIGLLGNIFSDYKIQYFISDLQYYLVIFFSYFVFRFFQRNKESYIVKNIIIYTLVSRSLINFIGYSSGALKGYYGGLAIFSVDPIDVFTIFLIFALSKNNNFLKNFIILTSWILGVISEVIFQSSGKGVLLFAIVLFEIVFLVLKSNYKWVRDPIFKTIFVTFIIFLIIFSFNLLNYLQQEYPLLKSKLNQAISLVSLKWINDPYMLPPSPRDRVFEIYNTYYYYLENPFYFLLGTGIGGYFEESKYYNPTAGPAGYSEYEVKSRHFYNPHESPANVFLKFGIVGIIMYIWVLFKILMDKNNSIFIKNIGFFVVLLFIGFSLKLALLVGYTLYTFLSKNMHVRGDLKNSL